MWEERLKLEYYLCGWLLPKGYFQTTSLIVISEVWLSGTSPTLTSHHTQCVCAGEALCALLPRGLPQSCNCISVTPVSAASRTAVGSVMSGDSNSVPGDGVVAVVGERRSIEETTSAIITAGAAPSNRRSVWLFSHSEKPEIRGCSMWSHPDVPPGATIKMRPNSVRLFVIFRWC